MNLKNLPRSVRDALDRAGRSAVQKFLLVMFAATPGVHVITSVSWYNALGVGIGAGVLSLVMSAATWNFPPLSYWPDLGLRLARSFLQSLLTTWGAAALDVFHISWQHTLLVALGMAGASFVTNYLGGNLGVEPAHAVPVLYGGGGGGGAAYLAGNGTTTVSVAGQADNPNAADQSFIPLADLPENN